ncbi:MAG: TIGR04552 family protein [Deltaproteobacteria bacterium]|nr:TIGR04552 family protein [Deltaproteobacteria bacterium]
MSDLRSIGFRTVDEFTLGDLDTIWNILRGDSAIDWRRLHLADRYDAEEFLRVQEFHPEDPLDAARLDAIKREAIDYLRRNYEYPIPGPIASGSVESLLGVASGRGHRQVCACVILKVMHIIHHLQGRELLFSLPLSDAQVFQYVEAKIFRVMGEMLSSGLPIVQFKGGRKNRDSLYTKLLSKSETIAAQIYDKLRFRIVTRGPEDVLPVLNYLSRRLFPFNYVIPNESKNTLVNPRDLIEKHPHLAALFDHPDSHIRKDAVAQLVDNRFSAPSYRVIHFVVDLPVRLPREVLDRAPETVRSLGPVVFVLTEFQIVDQVTDSHNDTGAASHHEYKERQREAVRERLRLARPRGSRYTRPPPPRR